MKNIIKLLFFYLLIFIIFSIFYFISFHSPLFISQKVLFYRGIELLLVAFISILLSGILLVKLLKVKYESLFASVILTLSIHVCLFVLFPVTFDRSITVFLLNSIQKNQINYSCYGLTKKELQNKLINEYVIKNDAISKRLIEQSIINNLYSKDDCFKLTVSGNNFLNFSRLIKFVYGIK